LPGRVSVQTPEMIEWANSNAGLKSKDERRELPSKGS